MIKILHNRKVQLGLLQVVIFIITFIILFI